jgi:branched-chain amino acid transport system permease protein
MARVGDAMVEFLGLTVTGLSLAGIYAITASGLTLTYATTRIFNFAQGAVGMIVAFCFWEIRYGLGWPVQVAWLLCIAVLAPVIGLVLERLLIRPMHGAPEVTRLVITVALMLFMVALAQSIWNPNVFRIAQEPFAGQGFTIASVRVTYSELIEIGIAIFVAAALRIALYHTRVGVTMRGTVDNRTLTRLSGVDPARMGQIAWVVSMMLAGLGGVLIAPSVSLSPLPLTLVIVDSYAAAVVGRLRSLPLTFVGAVILGLVVSYTTGYIEPTGNQYLLGLVAAVPAVVLFVALLVMRPSRLTQLDLRMTRKVLKPTWIGGSATGVVGIVFSIALVTILAPGDLLTAAHIWGVAIVALSLVPLVGYARRLSLCQLTFAGIGGVAVAHAGANIATILLAGVVAAIVGALVSLVTIRLSGIYMALSTAAVALVFDEWIFTLPPFTVFGHLFDLPQGGTLRVGQLNLLGVRVSGSAALLLFGSVVFALLTVTVIAVRRSRFGERLIAMSDSQQAAASVGVSARLHLLAVFSLSAAIAGIGGAVYVIGAQSVPIDGFEFSAGLPIVLFMVVGGVDSPAAAAVCGAFIAGPFLTDLVPNIPQITAFLVAGPAILLARNPDGVMTGAREAAWAIRRSPTLLVLLASGVVGSWVLGATGILTTREWVALTFVVLPSVVALAARRRAPAARIPQKQALPLLTAAVSDGIAGSVPESHAPGTEFAVKNNAEGQGNA